MTSNTWRILAQVLFVLALATAAGIGWTWKGCGDLVASLMSTEPEMDDVSDLANRIRAAQDTFRLQGLPVPESEDERAAAAQAACTDQFPVRESMPYGLGFVFFLVGGLMAHTQSKHAPSATRPSRTSDRGDRSNAPVRRAPLSRPTLELSQPIPVERDGIALNVEEELGFGLQNTPEEQADDEESLMAYVLERRDAPKRTEDNDEYVTTAIGGFFCPPGYEDKPSVYVDATSKSARDDYQDDTPINAPQHPFRTLEAAVAYATRRTVKDTPGMQVRVTPGVYQCSIHITDRVAVVNHRMPAEGTLAARLQWITELDLDDPDRVTILPPPNAEFAVRFGTGHGHGIFGCHLIGRERVQQAGIVASSAHKVAIFNCYIEGFSRGGIRLDVCGTEIPGNGTRVMACGIFANSAAQGGGIFATKSVLRISNCHIAENKAHNGGGLWVSDMKNPTLIDTTRFAENIAQAPAPEDDLLGFALSRWGAEGGTGGAICLAGGAMKISNSEFVDNAATLAGGALAVIGAKALVDADGEQRARLHRNKSRCGAAVFVAGWPSREATLKLTRGDVQHNEAGRLGGGIGGYGLSTIQVLDSKVSNNKTLDGRSVGAGVGVVHGAELLCRDTDFRSNQSAGCGGGVGAINATVRIADNCLITDCTAADSGGGVHCITQSNPQIEQLVSQAGLSLPFVLSMHECTVTSNTSGDLGGGVRAGNIEHHPTFPQGIKIEGTAKIRGNRTKHPNGMGDELWILWADDIVASTQNRPGPKLLLK